MTKQYIPLTTVLENYKTELSEAGVYDLRQLVEKVQSKNISIYYQLAYCDKFFQVYYFPLGKVSSTFRCVNGVKSVNGRQHYNRYILNSNTDDEREGRIRLTDTIRYYNLLEKGYSQCLNIKINSNEDDTLSFSQFFNQWLFDNEIVECKKIFDDNNAELFINGHYAQCMSSVPDYLLSDGSLDCEKVRKDSLANDTYKPYFEFYFGECIANTPNNFYLLRDDVEELVNINTDNKIQQLILQKLPNIKINTPAYNRLVELIGYYESEKFSITIVNNEIQETKDYVIHTLLKNLSINVYTDTERLINNFNKFYGFSFKTGRRKG